MDKMKHRRLQELDRSDFEIVKGEPDIRGWDVKTTTGQKIGEVEDLIVDARQKKVRYMIVDLDDNELKLDHRKVLLPIGLAELHEKDDDVVVPNVQADQLRTLPEYDADNINPETERRICSVLGRKTQMDQPLSEDTNADFYQHDYYNDDNLYKNRLHEARPAKKESEYEHGLKLWEKRSEGGILAGDRNDRETEINEDARMEMVRNRRSSYEQRRGGGFGRDRYLEGDRSERRDNSIEGRIRDEGLRDA